jgi:4-hydroxythreonine-4-phosphate dehydrogenase
LSSGEPAGIGPDICVMLAAEDLPARLLTLADADVLAARIADLHLDVTVRTVADPHEVEPHAAGLIQVLNIAAPAAVQPGNLDTANSAYVLELLRQGVALCAEGSNAALVTAPVHKSVINAAGISFTGHTEFLAEATATPTPVMMLASGKLRVALATTHLPLARVAEEISRERIERVLIVLDRELRDRFRLSAPRIAVLGLNPHAGESGVLGHEEQEIIEPVMRDLAERGLSLLGPVPADTAFTADALERCDAVLAMYHDQGLPVIKALAFGEVVNITLGLPIIRTSVDHGTALDLAGTGRAKPGSLREAIRVACELASERGP